MKRLTGYIGDYFKQVDKISFLIISLILSCLVFINYKYGLSSWVLGSPSFFVKFARADILYTGVFAGTYIILYKNVKADRRFFFLLVAAPLIFAGKVALVTSDVIRFPLDNYFRVVMQWPLKLILVMVSLLAIGYTCRYQRPFFGTTLKNANLRPYFVLLALMIPVVFAAGITTDFQKVYPKLRLVGFPDNLVKILLFELSYGLDFFTIELFFRGFLVLAFIKYAGRDAILPMAVFYCSIHFGKPLAECISSYFGGLILGAIVYNTRSIWGGLALHLGIAWIMEGIGILF